MDILKINIFLNGKLFFMFKCGGKMFLRSYVNFKKVKKKNICNFIYSLVKW